MQPGPTALSRPTSDRDASAGRSRSGRLPDAGEALEARVAQVWFWEGFYSRSAVDLTRHFHPEPLQVTDLDLLAFDFNPQLSRHKYIGEVKGGTGKNAPKALDRLVWLRGLRELVGAESGELTIAAPPSDRVREVGRSLGLVAQSVSDFERREREAVADFADSGAHGVDALQLRMRVRDICRGDPELERAYGFLRSGVWFLDPFTAIKQLIEILRRMKRRWSPVMQGDEQVALRWIMAEGVSVLALNTVTIAGLSVTIEKSDFVQLVNDRLAEGLIPMAQMRRISEYVDKFVHGMLAVANAPADVRTQAIGAFLPEPPDWAEPLAEIAWRMGRSALQARSLPRQIDLLVHERIARGRQVPEEAARRLGLERKETVRLCNLLAAFLRGCDAASAVVDEALSSGVILSGPESALPATSSPQAAPHPELLPLTEGEAGDATEPTG